MKRDYKRLALDILSGGFEGIEGAWEAGEFSNPTLVRAVGHLRGHSEFAEKADVFERWAEGKAFWATAPRGRRPPGEGDRRTYRAQDIGHGAFIRIPVDVLGICKKEVALVSFSGNKIEVTKAEEDK